MTDNTNDNLFDDEPTADTSETTSFDKEDDKSADEGAEEQSEETQEGEQAEGEESQGEQSEETPNSEEDGEGKSEKMIPESRFKAALKDVTDERDRLRDENAQMKSRPAPDKEKDPDGHALYNKIEMSKQIMKDAVPDYNDMIRHYNKMAEVNPSLNAAVAASDNPAKFAYDLAKRDLEISEVMTARTSGQWDQFLKWQKEQQNEQKNAEENKDEKKTEKVQPKVPVNLNRATSTTTKGKQSSSDNTDELFKGAL